MSRVQALFQALGRAQRVGGVVGRARRWYLGEALSRAARVASGGVS